MNHLVFMTIPYIKSSFKNRIDIIASNVINDFIKIKEKIKENNSLNTIENKVEIVYNFDSLVLTILQDTWEDLLGEFKENKKLNELKNYKQLYVNNDNKNNNIYYQNNNTTDYKNISIRIFKDHMKSYSGSDQNYIECSDPNNKNVVEEAYEYYNNFYKLKNKDLINNNNCNESLN